MVSPKEFKDICEQDTLYICDNCGTTFKAKEVALVDAATNLKMFTPPSPPIFIDKDGIIKGGGMKAEEGDCVLACPKCKTVHLFGFGVLGG